MRRICDVTDVKRIINTVGRWTDEEINNEIEFHSDEIYYECGDPLSAITTAISSDSTTTADDFYLHYYLGEKRVAYIERVFVGTATKRELTETTDFITGKNVGILKLNTSTVGGSRLDTSDDLIVQFVPSLYAKYCALRVAKTLLEKTDTIATGVPSKELEVVNDRIERQEQMINNRIGVVFSSSNKNYDPDYGINLKKVTQDHNKNKYLYRVDGLDD